MLVAEQVNIVAARVAGEWRLERRAGDREVGQLGAWIKRSFVLTAIGSKADRSDKIVEGKILYRNGGAVFHNGPTSFACWKLCWVQPPGEPTREMRSYERGS